MAETTEFVQGDYTFYIRPMDPFKALELLGDLQKTFLPAIGAAFGTTKLNEEKADEKADEQSAVTMADLLNKEINIQGALTQLASAINGTHLNNLLQRVVNSEYIAYSQSGSEVKRLDKAKLAEIYRGNLSGMFALAWKVLQVNYADFFTMLPIQYGKANENKNS